MTIFLETIRCVSSILVRMTQDYLVRMTQDYLGTLKYFSLTNLQKDEFDRFHYCILKY